MKTKKLLSLVTAVAVVATIGISYAQWDKTEGSMDGQIAIAEKMDVKATDVSFASDKLVPAGSFADTNSLAGMKTSLSSPLKVTIPASFEGKIDLELAVSKVNNGTKDLTAEDVAKIFDFTFKKAGTALTDNKDTTAAASNEYTVEVSLKSNVDTLTESQLADVLGKTLTLTVSATAVVHAAI